MKDLDFWHNQRSITRGTPYADLEEDQDEIKYYDQQDERWSPHMKRYLSRALFTSNTKKVVVYKHYSSKGRAACKV